MSKTRQFKAHQGKCLFVDSKSDEPVCVPLHTWSMQWHTHISCSGCLCSQIFSESSKNYRNYLQKLPLPCGSLFGQRNGYWVVWVFFCTPIQKPLMQLNLWALWKFFCVIWFQSPKSSQILKCCKVSQMQCQVLLCPQAAHGLLVFSRLIYGINRVATEKAEEELMRVLVNRQGMHHKTRLCAA